jgi:glycosyltransferase involved in cell wall biosynthesis
MRIAIVVTGGLHPSGREQVVPSWLSLFERLARNHTVHAFVLRHLPEAANYELNGVIVHDLGRPSAPFGLGAWAQQRALVRAIEAAGRFDLIHGFWGDPAGFLTVRTARRFSIPGVVTLDSGEFVALPDIEYGSQRTARGRARVRETCTKATRVHVCTNFMARGVDEPKGSSPPAGGGKPSGLPDGPPWRLLQVASLSRVKNQALLIEALAILAGTIDVHLDLVGEDTLRGALQAQAAALGIADRVTFHGFVPHDRIAAIRARSHLYVQTSRHESAGVAVLEAAAAGIPLVGTRAGYIADWVPDRAALMEPSSATAVAGAIAALLNDAAQRRRLVTAALEFARQHDAGATAKAVEEMYSTLA